MPHGVVRALDNLGRIVIPKEYRNSMGLADGQQVEMVLENNRVILQKLNIAECVICAGTKELASINGKLVCVDCRNYIKEEF